MKIAFVLNSFPVISETFILNQITGLLDRGHDVDIFAFRPQNSLKLHQDVKSYGLLRKTHYFEEVPESVALRLVKGLRLLINNFNKNPIAIVKSLNFLRYGRSALSLSNLYMVITTLGKGPYDIIQCHFGTAGCIGVMLRDMGAVEGRIVTSFHGYDMSSYIRLKGEDVYERLFSLGDMFLPISERWKDELIRLGCKEEKIIVHRMGVDPNRFVFSSRLPDEGGKIRLLTIARLVEKKGIQYAIEAVARVIKIYPQTEYRIVGDGPLRVYLEDLIKQLNLGGNVELLGCKDQEEVIELMRESHVLVAPSVTDSKGDQEGIPMVLMEAMALGLPVVSTFHSGIPELVEDGVSGFLVPERDAESLAERLEHLIKDPEIRTEMGRAGRKRIEKQYDIYKLNNRLVKIYQKSLN